VGNLKIISNIQHGISKYEVRKQMSEKEKNTENNQKKFDLQERFIDYAVRFWLPSPCLVTNTKS